MPTLTTDKKQTAQKEISSVLKRYSLTWQDVIPDTDENLWRDLKPLSKKIRKKLFRKVYLKTNAQARKK